MPEKYSSDILSVTRFEIREDEKRVFDLSFVKLPTGGNCKPFQWSWLSNSVRFTHDNSFARHYLNRNNHTSLIALGALIETIKIVANGLGLNIECEADTRNLSLMVRFTGRSQPTESARIGQVLNRKTFRGLFEIQSPNAVLTSVTGASNLRLNSKAWTEYLLQSSMYIWSHKKACKDFFKEIRFFSKKPSTQERGIPLNELLLKFKDELALFAFSLIPALVPFIIKRPVIRGIFIQNTLASLANSNFLLVTVKSTEPAELVNLGGTVLVAWLSLEQQGYKVQPFSTASIPIFDAKAGFLPKDTHDSFRQLFSQAGPDVLQNSFGLQEDEIPVWLFRYGKTCRS